MTTIYLTVVSFIIAFILSAIWAPLGGIWLAMLLYGLLINLRERQMKISADLQLIKEKLGVVEQTVVDFSSKDFHMSDKDIEQELEQHMKDEGKHSSQDEDPFKK